MFNPPWSVSNHNFYMGMQNVQKLEDWSDGFLNFTFSSDLWPNMFSHTEATQSQCLPPMCYVSGQAQGWRPLPHKCVTAWDMYSREDFIHVRSQTFFSCLVCGSLLEKNYTQVEKKIMFSPLWSISNNFYMDMQNVQKLEDWSDGFWMASVY